MSRWVVVLSLGAGLFVMGAQVRAQALEKSALGSSGVQGTLAKAPGATCAAGKSTRGTSGPRGMGQKAPGATCAAGKSGPGGVGNEPEAGPETTWHGRRWTLEAGIGVFGSHALSEFRHDAVGVAGWVGVGGEHIRVEVDYWHQQRREEYVESFELFGGTLGESDYGASDQEAVSRTGIQAFCCRPGDCAACRDRRGIWRQPGLQMSRDARRV